MKVGDIVGWRDTWSDEEGCDIVGLILSEFHFDDEWECKYFEILDNKTGSILQHVEESALVVVSEGR